MSLFNNWKIGTRLSLGFGLIIILATAMALIGYMKLSAIHHEVDLLTSDQMSKVSQLSAVKDNLNVVARGVRNIALLSDDQAKQAEKKRIDDMRAKNADLLLKLDTAIRDDDGRARLKDVMQTLTPYDQSMDKAITLALGGDGAAATQVLLKEVRPLQTAYFKAVDALVGLQQQDMQEAVAAIQATAQLSSTLMLILAGLVATLGSLLAWAIQRSVVKPLSQAVSVARTVAAGDLTSHIVVTSQDETGELLASMKDMNQSLSNLVSLVRTSSDAIATGSTQIANGNADLSQRTEEQASSLQETAASMEQISGAVRQSADTTAKAHHMAEQGIHAAQRGGQSVAQVVATMQEIAEASRKVTDIISVIDGIAFQTNILALNAAVEAARAGEQGRGFAVVASEVRLLAQRSANAAKEIKTLIGNSVDRVEAGAHQVQEAGQAMQEIVTQVQHIGQMISAIATSTAEQNTGIGQVNGAINLLDQVTQQNAALVEEGAAAAESLRHQAANLAELVHSFKLPAC